MKKWSFVVFVFGTFLYGACSTNNEIEVDNVSLNGEQVGFDFSEGNHKFPSMMLGNIFLVRDSVFSAFTKKTNSWVQSDVLFRFGKGHNEFQDLSFGMGNDKSLLIINQPFTTSKLTSLTSISKTDSVAGIKDVNNWKKYDLGWLPSMSVSGHNFISLSDSTILVLGAPYDEISHIMTVVDYKNQTVNTLDFWPDDGLKSDSFPKHGIYSDDASLYSDENGHYMYQCGTQRYVFIFTIEGEKINVIKNLHTNYPKYHSDDMKLNYIIEPDSPVGRLYCATNRDNIYILLKDCDKNGLELEKWVNPYIYGNIVEVYDWQGNLKTKFKLDKFGQRIMVSDDNKILYLFTDDYYSGEDSKPEIWSYKIQNNK